PPSLCCVYFSCHSAREHSSNRKASVDCSIRWRFSSQSFHGICGALRTHIRHEHCAFSPLRDVKKVRQIGALIAADVLDAPVTKQKRVTSGEMTRTVSSLVAGARNQLSRTLLRA